ncbi:alpha/beta hydrolase [Prosthecobacter sp. SYSU 5D2]|uniref:alpha/beta hydrolase n=1 Tax=Prosthecobacter sp. SYSU 5D2 TaxID=3134134 RepID=UPI0031FE6DCF
MSRPLFLLALNSLLLLSTALAAPKGVSTKVPRFPEDLKIINNIVFKEAGGRKLDLMLFQPAEKKFEKAPLVVYIHGGGWGGGDKYKVLRQDIIGVVRSLNQHGIACASIEYRLVDGKPTTANDAVADCKDAVRFLARHAAEYGLDPDRIGTFGSSAGGHLTLVTALGQEADYPCDPTISGPPVQVRCVASYYPLVSFVDRELMKGSNFERPQRLLPLLGGPLEEKRDLALKLSPIELLRPGSPPIFVAHGDADVVLNHSNALALRDAATAKGIPIECLISKGAGHGFSGDNIQPALAEIQARTVAFLLKHLE